MKICQLTPDKTLADAINNILVVQTSADESHTIKAYYQSSMPNVGLSDEFISIMHNGLVRSMTYPIGVFRGNLAVTIYCKSNSNATAKFNRINSLLAQLQDLIENKTFGEFHFKFSADNVITPITVNSTTGYATTVVNVEWHTT